MKWGEKIVGSKDECLQYLYQVINQLAGGILVLDGMNVAIPDEMLLEYKVKYAEDPGETKFSLKVAWANDIPPEEIPEEDIVWEMPSTTGAEDLQPEFEADQSTMAAPEKASPEPAKPEENG